MLSSFLLGALMPFLAHAQNPDSLHIVVDGTATANTPHTYRTFQEASPYFTDGVTVYIRPGVYWIDNPDDASVKVGEKGREPFGMVIQCPRLRLIGLGQQPQDVVLASQRGQTQGAIGNFTMFDFWCDSLYVENLTMGNYCNVDLVYPLNPRLNRPKRSNAITQAHVGYVHGNSLVAKKVRFISRLNLNPLNGARHSYYEDCHFECTDDALNGTATYRHCDFDLYGQKPFWSTFGSGAMFIDCDFFVKGSNREMYFCKQGGPVTVIDCRYHAPSDSINLGWTAYPQPWLRCYQKNFLLNGKPYVIGKEHPKNTVVLTDYHGPMPPFLPVSCHEATLLTGQDTLLLMAPDSVTWKAEPGFEQTVSLRSTGNDKVMVIPTNDSDETADFCLIADATDGRQAACHLIVKPAQLPAPDFMHAPRIVFDGQQLLLDYALDLQRRRDESLITWYRDEIPVVTSHITPSRTYLLNEADKHHLISAVITPKHQRSNYGQPASATFKVKKSPKRHSLSTDFHDFYCGWQPIIAEGLWTVDGYKPEDTAEFPWSFDRTKPMWEYGKGFNGAVGMGLLEAQRGARLMFTPTKQSYGDMSLTLHVDPTKTAGQGFGSATGQYMDICLKFDTQTLTGYGLRIIRTTKHAKAVDFYLVKYDHGQVTPLTEPVSATCYRTNCTISIDFIGKKLTAHVETATPQPADSSLPHRVDLTAEVAPNNYGGIHIQHTGSCGESTTMLHHLQAKWGK